MSKALRLIVATLASGFLLFSSPIDTGNATEERVPADVFLPIDAELTILKRTGFFHDRRHGAVAIGPAQAVGFADHSNTPEIAAGLAKYRCERALEQSSYRSVRRRKCHIYMIDGKVVLPEKTPEHPFGSILEGPDRPLKRALYDRKPKGRTKGIVLHLHGCNRLKSFPMWTNRWFRYFRSRGFHVIAPDSFADSRLPERCGTGKTTPLKVISNSGRIVRFRAAQTRRTIRLLKEKYPALPLIVWGHSEGGAVAQLIPDNVAGIIASGVLCGIRRSRDLMVKRTTPLLLLLGEKDHLAYSKKRPSSEIKEYCSSVLKSPAWTFVMLRGVGHFPSIRSKPVQEPVSDFIDTVLQQHSTN